MIKYYFGYNHVQNWYVNMDRTTSEILSFGWRSMTFFFFVFPTAEINIHVLGRFIIDTFYILGYLKKNFNKTMSANDLGHYKWAAFKGQTLLLGGGGVLML